MFSSKKRNKLSAILPSSISIDIYFVAIFMALLGISTNMLYSYLAISLKCDLNLSLTNMANIDGTVEFLSYILRVFSGAISDFFYSRKILLLIGAAIITLSKPIFSIANSVIMILSAEILERLGNGILASPRDALIADLSLQNNLGASFGFCKSMKTLGGLIGAGIAVFIMYFSDNNYKLLFCLSALPALMALLCLIKVPDKSSTSLNEKKINDTNKKEYDTNFKNKKFENPFQKKYLRSLDNNFYKLMLFAFVCELGHFAESLLTIKSMNLLSPNLCGSVSLFSMFGQIIFSYFVCIKSDNYNKLSIIRINLILLLFSYFALSNSVSKWIFLFGIFIFFGQYAVLQALFLTVINKNVSSYLRATAIGVFYMVIGISYMMTAKLCGMLCDNYSYNLALLCTAIFISLAFAMSFFVKTEYYR
ncbi:MAG: MFS transporter [Alphaproteobacteria bacterium]|nr:MFS transporter [Alphaproteobacteria bacterium]